jgi:hypothetical protein
MAGEMAMRLERLVGCLAIGLNNHRFSWLAVGLLVAGLARSNLQRMEDRSP